MEKQNCCAVFGQHPICFKWGFDEEDDGCRKMKLELLQQIMALRQHGVNRFLVACDFGVGLYAAEQINVLREQILTSCFFASHRMKNRQPNGRLTCGSGILTCW